MAANRRLIVPDGRGEIWTSGPNEESNAVTFQAQNPNSDPLRKVQSPDPGLCRLETG